MDFDKLIEIIDSYDSINVKESWGYIEISCDINKRENLQKIKLLKDYLSGEGFPNSISIKIDNARVDDDDLDSYLEDDTSNWEININKIPFFNTGYIDVRQNFFYSIEKFQEWLSGLSPFEKENPFHKKNNLIINGLDHVILGDKFKIIPYKFNGNIESFVIGESLPDLNRINEVVHSLTSEELIISPLSFVYQTKSNNETIISILNKLASISLSASIVNEIKSDDFITVDGIRRLNLKLFDDHDIYKKEFYNDLLKVVKWIYEEKTITRQKLFNDRISLELDESKTYINALSIHLKNSLSQASQRYNFVILERKDKYISELKDLLKDVRSQSDLYSQKIRTLLNNLLRDVLAAIVLVGFTIFTKFSDNLLLDKISLLKYVFYFLAIYYVLSAIIQAIVDITDVQVSKNEMLYWKATTKELIPEKDFKKHIENSLKDRKRSLKILYPTIIILYLLLAYTCYKFPIYFHSISSEKTKKEKINNDKVSKYRSQQSSGSSGR
ncbi:hypothetical protein A0O34_21400 [Chryseobacterium glaciei]|uniref:Uncharacterized protein n=1 Tax=Chryseobacterium glaciei TaxID=1685010 RepID=A0A172Y0Y0_9FLAO|nr:hypothetical protein [Chryseobacterium glaciei]ANF52918.1 hypothetical protein A0O34_21400 [Chryseobacterium glaciei]